MESTDWIPGKIGNALSFDGVNESVNTSDKDYFSPSVNTVAFSLWARIPSNAPAVGDGTRGGSGAVLIGKGMPSNYEWSLENDGNSKLFFTSYVPTGGSHGWVQVNRAMNDGQWHHYAGVMKEPSTRMTLYIDGVQAGVTTTFFNSPMVNGTAPLTIGQRGDGNYFTGDIDDVRI
jgi:hypothetical protein